jgi:hypothetical protein
MPQFLGKMERNSFRNGGRGRCVLPANDFSADAHPQWRVARCPALQAPRQPKRTIPLGGDDGRRVSLRRHAVQHKLSIGVGFAGHGTPQRIALEYRMIRNLRRRGGTANAATSR